MAKKKNIIKNDIISFYMDYVLEHNAEPKSVYIFAKNNNFDEAKFYEYFGGLDAIEKDVFNAFFDNTHKALATSKEYETFNPRNKLLSFYYTFFENLTANRSYVVYVLHKNKNSLKTLSSLSGLKTKFSQYILDLGIDLIDVKQKQLENFQNKGLKDSAWIQFLLTLKFWLDDSSPSFEKTDIFIEKSVNASFDVLKILPIKSIIDFGKFIFKEKMQMS